MMAVGAATQLTINTLVVGALFLPFHASDIRGFYEERQWGLIVLRYLFLCLIRSFLVGLFGLTLGFIDIQWYLIYTLVLAAPTLFVVVFAYLVFAIFLPESSFFVRLKSWVDGQKVGGKLYGIWWDY
jgi:hypothetical protein